MQQSVEAKGKGGETLIGLRAQTPVCLHARKREVGYLYFVLFVASSFVVSTVYAVYTSNIYALA